MKPIALLLLLSSAAMGSAALAKPAVEVLPLDGYAQKVLAPRKGHRFAVNFWATWCEPCREELPSLLAGAAAKKVELVLVSLDAADRPEPLREFLQSVRAAGSLVVAAGDPQPFIDGIDKKWDGTLPYTIIYGADGRIVTRLAGAQTRAGFERALTP
jgi:thiol-disulfide isomerase/thioredoxin